MEGLAWPTALAYSVAAVVALVVLRRRVGRLEWPPAWAAPWRRSAAACGVMAVAVLVVAERVGDDAGRRRPRAAGVGVVGGAWSYVGAVVVLRVDEVDRRCGAALRGAVRDPGTGNLAP